MPPQTLTLTDNQQVVIGPVSGVDARGKPTSLGGVLDFETSDGSIIAVQPSADGASATIIASGNLGTGQVTITDGVGTQIINVTVIGGAEVGLAVPIGVPQEQPALPPADATPPAPAPTPAAGA